VLLAMPAIWLAWKVSFELYVGEPIQRMIGVSRSMTMYIVCIMSFVWRTGTTDDENRGPMTSKEARTFRILLTVVLSLGLIYFIFIASTLRRYGEMMDQEWDRRAMGWVNEVVPAHYSPLGIIPRVLPVMTMDGIPVNTQSPLISDFARTSNLFSMERQDPETKPTTTRRSRSVSLACPGFRQGSNSSSRPVGPYAESSIPNPIQEHNHGTRNTRWPVIISTSKPLERDEDLNHDLESPPGDTQPPPPTHTLLPVPVPAPPPLLNSLGKFPVADVDHQVEVRSNKSQELIKFARLLYLSFEDDIPLDVPPLEDELKTWYMTKELWEELQIVSAATL